MKIKGSLTTNNIQEPKEFIRFASIQLDQIIDVINGNVSLTDNCSAKLISVTFTSANTDVQVAHQLSRLPQGFLLAGGSAAFTVYNGSAASTEEFIYLRASSTGSANILVF